jgi:hypothetical protein
MKKPAGDYLGARQKMCCINNSGANFILTIIANDLLNIIKRTPFHCPDDGKLRITVKIQLLQVYIPESSAG